MVSRASFTLQLSSGNAIKASIFVLSKSDYAAITTHTGQLYMIHLKVVMCTSCFLFICCTINNNTMETLRAMKPSSYVLNCASENLRYQNVYGFKGLFYTTAFKRKCH